MSDEDEAHSAHRLVQFSDGVFTVALTLQIGARHRAII